MHALRASILVSAILLIGLLSAPQAVSEEAHVAPAKAYMNHVVRPWLNVPLILEAIKAQNAANADLDQSDITALDQRWRAEVETDTHPMIDEKLANAVSKFLRSNQVRSGGMITEMFIMDNRGLNVGQSTVTSDYWQGDEAKFTMSFKAGAGALFVEAPVMDESTQMLQAHASMTIVDEGGAPIGAITVGINLDKF